MSKTRGTDAQKNEAKSETCGKTLFKSFLNVGKSLLNTQTHSYDKTMFFIVLQEDRSSQTMEAKCSS